MDERFNTEIRHLLKIKSILDADSILPLRFEVERKSLDFSRFELTIKGIQSLIGNPSLGSSAIGDTFLVAAEIASGYPWSAVPGLRFRSPIPFHPHIWPDGRLCWGSGGTPQPDLALADWIRGIIEYLQYNQEEGSMWKIDANSPANPGAMEWWKRNRGNLSRYIRPIDMARLRAWIDRSRG